MSAPKWQGKSWDRRKLWDLVCAKFAEPGKVGRASVEITRDDLVREGLAHMLDDLDAPTTTVVPSFMDGVDSVRAWNREHGAQRAQEYKEMFARRKAEALARGEGEGGAK